MYYICKIRISRNSKIFLTFNEGGKYLIKSEEYTSASVHNGTKKIQYDCGVIAPELIVDVPSKIKRQPEYADCNKKVILNYSFIERALEFPECPYKRNTGEYHWWLKSDMGKLALDFKKLNDEQKIKRHIEIYVKDMTGILNPVEKEDYSYQLIFDDNEDTE